MPIHRRAIDAADKHARRAAILDAATHLFTAGDGSLPHIAQVAARADLAKGTVYLYFPSQGALFAAILLEGWSAVVDSLEECFRFPTTEREDPLDRFLITYVDYLRGHPQLLRLDALGHGVLERNMGVQDLIDFKRSSHERLAEGAAVLERGLGLPEGRGLQLLMRTYALSRGLWQAHGGRPGTPSGGRPNWEPFADLLEALREYWRGALLTNGQSI